MDLALALVEEDLGAQVALNVARQLVIFLKRPGGQAQFSSALSAQQAARPALRDLQAWIAGHLEEDLTVPILAERALMSERTFARAFHREVGQTPAAYVEALRIERARDLLEDGAPSLEGVAQATGFASAEVLRRAFHRRVGVSPAEYRDRFRLKAWLPPRRTCIHDESVLLAAGTRVPALRGQQGAHGVRLLPAGRWSRSWRRAGQRAVISTGLAFVSQRVRRQGGAWRREQSVGTRPPVSTSGGGEAL